MLILQKENATKNEEIKKLLSDIANLGANEKKLEDQCKVIRSILPLLRTSAILSTLSTRYLGLGEKKIQIYISLCFIYYLYL